ncbi:MAG: alpha/beta hydrolase-fold protein [Pseudomonadota bacterium]
MLIKIIVLLASLVATGCGSIKQSDSLGISIPESLSGLALTVNVTDTSVYDPTIHFYRNFGQETTYFSEHELFYDASGLNGWHFAIDYSLKKHSENSLIIATHFPASRTAHDLLTFRQTLIFTSRSGGNTVIEFYHKEQLAFMHKGTFILNNKVHSIISGALEDQIFNFRVENINKDSSSVPLNVGDKIAARFLSEQKIQFSVAGAEYIGTNHHYEQTSVSQVKLRGTLNKNNLPYEISLNYYDFSTGAFELSFSKNSSAISGQFESQGYPPIVPIALKGERVQGNKLLSQHTGISYPYEIYLPPGYANSKANYSVVYVTDGQWDKDLVYIAELRKKKVIMVFVEQGPDERRFIDYQLPGANAYIQFLKQELVPLIESNYRVNETRSFFGNSFGGLLGGILISQETTAKPFFKNYILSDGSFWGITPETIAAEQTRYADSQKLPLNILLSGTFRGNAVHVAEYEKRFRDRHYQHLKIVNKTYPYLHSEMANPTFMNFVDFID